MCVVISVHRANIKLIHVCVSLCALHVCMFACVLDRQERPRSAVEQQLCAGESGRPRMSVEEQLERIRRHQQGALREKKKGLSILGGSHESTPSRSHSFTKENPFRSMQVGRCRHCVDNKHFKEALRAPEFNASSHIRCGCTQ